MAGYQEQRSSMKGYQYDPRVFEGYDQAYDMVLLGLYSSFMSNRLTQDFQKSSNRDTGVIVQPWPFRPENYEVESAPYRKGGGAFADMLERYKRQVAREERIPVFFDQEIEDITKLEEEDFGAIGYDVSKRSRSSTGDPKDGFRSMLYTSVEYLSEEFPRTEAAAQVCRIKIIQTP